jgi:hypothetical protein
MLILIIWLTPNKVRPINKQLSFLMIFLNSNLITLARNGKHSAVNSVFVMISEHHPEYDSES